MQVNICPIVFIFFAFSGDLSHFHVVIVMFFIKFKFIQFSFNDNCLVSLYF